ncbi:MAG: ABC transporter substrate-binding protein [Chloroflexi bacterium]|nr:ABC transporter substrate-binding protein [Chloroflexota bacterium]
MFGLRDKPVPKGHLLAGKVIYWPLLCLMIVLAPVPACQSASIGPAPKFTQPEVQTVKRTAWEEMVEAARKEGSVNIYGSVLGAASGAVRSAGREKFGLNVDIIEGRPEQTVAKLTAEIRAGLHLGDLGLMGRPDFINDVRPLGITAPLAPLLILPEITDPANWRNGKIPYTDKDGHSIGMVAMAIYVSIYNTDVVQGTEIGSFMDYLQPKWKGKIVLSDPGIVGGANNFFTHLASNVFGMEKTVEILRQLAAQEPVVTRDQRLLLEWVARGKYPVGIGHSSAMYAEFKRLGAPITLAILKEPPHLSSGSGNIFVFDKAPHPNAAKLLLNWLLSKEGASVWSSAHGYPSQRVDAPNEGFDPSIVPRDGTFLPDETYLRAQGEMRQIAGQIFAGLRK